VSITPYVVLEWRKDCCPFPSSLFVFSYQASDTSSAGAASLRSVRGFFFFPPCFLNFLRGRQPSKAPSCNPPFLEGPPWLFGSFSWRACYVSFPVSFWMSSFGGFDVTCWAQSSFWFLAAVLFFLSAWRVFFGLVDSDSFPSPSCLSTGVKVYVDCLSYPPPFF